MVSGHVDMRSGKRMDMVGSSPELQLAAWCHSPCFKPIPILIDDQRCSGFISGCSLPILQEFSQDERSAGGRLLHIHQPDHTTKDHLDFSGFSAKSSR